MKGVKAFRYFCTTHTVSYTHLDVYKRQLASGAPLFSGIITGIVGGLVVSMLSGSALSVSGPAAGSVSYTHLDVYKRQVQIFVEKIPVAIFFGSPGPYPCLLYTSPF